jgi:hypothetical protein
MDASNDWTPSLERDAAARQDLQGHDDPTSVEMTRVLLDHSQAITDAARDRERGYSPLEAMTRGLDAIERFDMLCADAGFPRSDPLR